MEPLSGIVLAGGASRRLGADKTTLRFGSRTLLEHAVDALSAVCTDVLVAGGDATAWPHLGARLVPDESRGRGPLAGLQAGLKAAELDFALVVACDLPFLNRDLLAFMARRPRRCQALVPRWGRRLHPLHAIYGRSCLPVIESLLAKPSASMRELLAQLDIETLAETAIQRFDPEGLSFFNINSPDDFERAQAIWAELVNGVATGR